MAATLRDSTARLAAVPRSSGRGQSRLMASIPSGLVPAIATRWSNTPSNVNTFAELASHNFTAAAAIASNTGWASVGERERDAQDLAGGGLLLERFAQFPVARLEFLEEPNVLDRDHGLIGKGLQQSDLFSGNGPGRAGRRRWRRRIAFAHQRNAQYAAETPSRELSARKVRVHMRNREWRRRCATARPGWLRSDRAAAATAAIAFSLRDWFSRDMEQLAVKRQHVRRAGIAQFQRGRRDRVETGWASVGERESTRRISLVAVCCSSASVSSRLRASSSLNSRTFSIAITA